MKVTPKWTDLTPMEYVIEDKSLANIYGAIAEYGSKPEYFNELKEYIIEQANNI